MWRCVVGWEIFDVSENRNSFVSGGWAVLLFVLFEPEGEGTKTFWAVGEASNETSSLLRRRESSGPQLGNPQTPRPRFPPGPISLGIEKYHSQIHLYIPMRSVWMYISYDMVHRDHVSINACFHTQRQTNKQTKHQADFFYCCTVHFDICRVFSPTNALLLIEKAH